MKRLAVTFALACAGFALASPAQAAITVGVTDGHPIGQPDGGAAFFALMNDVGLQEVRFSVPWDATQPLTIPNQSQIESVLPVATLRGIKVVFSVAPAKARSITVPGASAQFVAYLDLVARTFPTVKDIVVGNEPNQPRFWQPQFDLNGRGVSGAAYEALLAQSYDALKAVDPTINVIGVGLSPRGNDNPRASGNVSTSPVKFLQGMGTAYRASGRTKPLMDELAYHPYPRTDRSSLIEGYVWPNAGVTNFDRIKQAFWDAFGGTGQKTFEQGLRVKFDEVGWQVAVAPESLPAYFGVENIVPTTEAAQASIYAGLIRYVACDPATDSVLFFGLRDEPNLDRWQAALMRADGSTRPSYDAVRSTIAETGGNCAGAMRSWRHSTAVDGATATFRRDRRLPSRVDSWAFLASAREDALFDAGIYRVTRARPTLTSRTLGRTGRLDAHLTRYVRFPTRRLRPGTYVYSIRFRAEANLSRSTRRTSRPFVIYRAR
ncbi:MAG: hypothetical protein AABM30_12045 [Actinomycetota bacterium]